MPNAISLNNQQPANVQCTATIAASAASGTQYTATVYPYGTSLTGVTNMVIPSNEVWHLIGAYVPSSQTTDYNIGFIINGLTQPLLIEANAIIVTNSAKYSLPTSLVMLPNANVQVQITTLAAAGTSAYTATFYLNFIRVPLK